MTLNLPSSYWFWFVEYCQTSPDKNNSPNLWHVTSILVLSNLRCELFKPYLSHHLVLIWDLLYAHGVSTDSCSLDFFLLCSPDCQKQSRIEYPMISGTISRLLANLRGFINLICLVVVSFYEIFCMLTVCVLTLAAFKPLGAHKSMIEESQRLKCSM